MFFDDGEASEASPGAPELASDLNRRWVWIGALGGIALCCGRVTRAAELYQQCLAIAEGLVARDPNNTDHQRDLSVSYDRLADLARAAGDTAEADG